MDIDSSSKLTKLDEINVDSLLRVCDYLRIVDLNSLGLINRYLFSVTREATRSRFSQKTVKFNIFLGRAMDESVKKIHINRELDSRQIVKEFGSSIQKMEIAVLSSREEAIDGFMKLVEEHCSETLVQLNLVNTQNFKLLRNILRPFKNVQSIELRNEINLSNDNLNLNEMFPSLRRLSLPSSFDTQNFTKLDLKFPVLEHLKLGFLTDYNGIKPFIANIIQKNAQIRSVDLEFPEWNMIKFIADHLPNLEHLNIFDYSSVEFNAEDRSNIHFEHLKTFKGIGEFPEMITFGDKIEYFRIYEPMKNTKFIDVIESSKSLKKLEIHTASLCLPFDEDSMARLTAAQLNINKMYFTLDGNIGTSSIIKFIESCKYLEYFNLHLLQGENEVFEIAEILHKHFQNQWTLDVINGEKLYIVLQKKYRFGH